MSPRPTTSTRPQSSPTCSSWTRRRSSPTKSLLRTPTTMTLHSKTCSTKHIERNPITLYEKTCLSVCRRRQCPIERGDPLEIDRGDPVSTETQKHRVGLYLRSKDRQFLRNVAQESVITNSKRLKPKKFNNEINNFFKDNYYLRDSGDCLVVVLSLLHWLSTSFRNGQRWFPSSEEGFLDPGQGAS